jgi:hypothetical protein
MRALLLGALLLLAACATPGPGYTVVAPKRVGPAMAPLKECQGGCAFTRNKADDLGDEKIDALFAKVSKDAVGAESESLDMLLFHDGEVRAHLAHSRGKLPPAWEAWLGRELDRQSAFFSLRIVDEQGKIRAVVPETRMALGVKLHMEVTDGDRTGPFNANGTIVRVGRDHLWIRM